jgi:hypothetical protein
MELERFRKSTQKDVKNMYDKALEDKHKVKQMEQQMDEVKKTNNIFLFFVKHLFLFRKKMMNFVLMQKLRRKLLE